MTNQKHTTCLLVRRQHFGKICSVVISGFKFLFLYEFPSTPKQSINICRDDYSKQEGVIHLIAVRRGVTSSHFEGAVALGFVAD